MAGVGKNPTGNMTMSQENFIDLARNNSIQCVGVAEISDSGPNGRWLQVAIVSAKTEIQPGCVGQPPWQNYAEKMEPMQSRELSRLDDDLPDSNMEIRWVLARIF